jgi:hypothetical protein
VKIRLVAGEDFVDDCAQLARRGQVFLEGMTERGTESEAGGEGYRRSASRPGDSTCRGREAHRATVERMPAPCLSGSLSILFGKCRRAPEPLVGGERNDAGDSR